MNNIYLSVIIPAYNEEQALEATLNDVIQTCVEVCTDGKQFEIIVVDDGSTDGTTRVVRKNFSSVKQIKLFKLAVNSGHMAALSAGYRIARGDWVVTLDGDGQDPPKFIKDMVRKVEEEKSDVCFAIRRDRNSDPIRHKLFSPLFYKLLNMSTSGKTPLQAADFRLVSKRVVESLNNLNESNLVYRVLVSELRFKTSSIVYERTERKNGKSKYGFFKLTKLALKSFLATSGLPLRVLSLFSIVIAIITALFAIIIFLISFDSEIAKGWTSLALLISFLMLFQSITTALISEILLQINSDVRKRPLYQESLE